MFQIFMVIRMLIELLRLYTAAITLATFGWRNSFYANQFSLEFEPKAFICKLRFGRSHAASRCPGASVYQKQQQFF